jgi:hypothetical protein
LTRNVAKLLLLSGVTWSAPERQVGGELEPVLVELGEGEVGDLPAGDGAGEHRGLGAHGRLRSLPAVGNRGKRVRELWDLIVAYETMQSLFTIHSEKRPFHVMFHVLETDR